MAMGQRGAARVRIDGRYSDGMGGEALRAGLGEQRCARAGKQRLFDAQIAQTAHEQQDLALAAAEFPSGIEVENAHQLMNRALAYLTNV